MKTLLRSFTLLLSGSLCLICPVSLQAQLVVSDTFSTLELVDQLFGAGITVSNVIVNCDTTTAMGYFDASVSNLGIQEGVLLTTGDIDFAEGPSVLSGGGLVLGLPGDSMLNPICMAPTHDACAIEFDVFPACDTLLFHYAFASYEYNEYVGDSVNDGFAIFIDGAGYPAPTNIALTPDSLAPITVNSLNYGNSSAGVPPTGPCINCGYYVDNTGGAFIGYNGFSTPLMAYATVIPDSVYHVKVVIADAYDEILDSGVFLKKKGISGKQQLIQISNQGSNTSLGSNVLSSTEGDTISLKLSQTFPLATDRYVSFEILGTAVSGTDYVNLPDSVLIPAGAIETSFPVVFLDDCIPEGLETLVFVYSDSSLSCGSGIYTDTLVIEIQDGPLSQPINIGSDTTFCSGSSFLIGIPAEQGLTYHWNSGIGLSDSTISQPVFSLSNLDTLPLTQTYNFAATSASGCTVYDTISLTVLPNPAPFALGDSLILCSGDSALIGTSAQLGVSYSWSSGDGLSDSTLSQPMYSLETMQLITTNYLLTAAGMNGCTTSNSLSISVYPEIEVMGNLVDTLCLGNSLIIPFSYTNATYWDWDFGDGYKISGAISNPSHVYLYLGTYTMTYVIKNGGCEWEGQDFITVESCATSIPNFLPKSMVRIYPNPADDLLLVQFESEIQGEVWLLNLHGQKIKHSGLNGLHQIDVSDLATGLYSIYGITSEGIFIQKVAIRR